MLTQNKRSTIGSMGKKILSTLLFITLTIIIPISSAEAQVKQSNQPSLPNGIISTPLTPDKNSEVILDAVEIKTAPDGTITIEANGGPIDGMPMFAYDISIDTRQGTYKTELVPLSDVKIYPSQQGSSGDNKDNSENSWSSPNNVQPLAIAPGTYQAKILVQTLDPVFLVLAQTTNYLKWTVSSSGSVQWKSYTDGCAGFPTPLGTHWYVSSCPSNLPYYRSGIAYNEAAGTYYNWDWGNPNLATYSSHWVSVGGKNDGHCTYSWTYSDWGEDATLTWGRRVVVQCP